MAKITINKKQGNKMNQTTVLNKINDLSYKGLKEGYLRQIEDPNYLSLSFDERLYSLLEAQEIYVHNKTITNNILHSLLQCYIYINSHALGF